MAPSVSLSEKTEKILMQIKEREATMNDSMKKDTMKNRNKKRKRNKKRRKSSLEMV